MNRAEQSLRFIVELNPYVNVNANSQRYVNKRILGQLSSLYVNFNKLL